MPKHIWVSSKQVLILFSFVLALGLGKLAQKFPNIAGTSISYLRDFLVDPSPILAKLHAQAVAQQKKEKELQPFKIVGKSIGD